ncbi:YebC/PmpR family DNA-binding transcriptional regulator, partial [Escherichia coli]
GKDEMDTEAAANLKRLIDMLGDCDEVQKVCRSGESSDEVAATL